jgi:hypothetical protein
MGIGTRCAHNKNAKNGFKICTGIFEKDELDQGQTREKNSLK